jgi:ABC-type glycerol-3-phosphate transport system permease component
MHWKEIPVYVRIPIYILMSFLAFLTIAPFMYFISLSLSKFADTYNIFLWPTSFEVQNYTEAWNTVNLGVHYRNSLYVTLLALALNLSLGSMAAYAMARYDFPLREPIYNFFLAGLILSSEALLIPLFLNAKAFGILNKWWTLPIIYATLGLPFTIFVLRAFFETLPSELVDAATVDGCNAFQSYFYVMLPLSRSALLTVGLFQFVWFWDEFILAISLITNDNLRTLTAGLAKLQGEYFIDYPVLAAALVLTVIPVILVYILTQRQLIRGMTVGAMK